MLMILHPETGVACSRNSPLSLRGRLSASLLHHALSEPTGVATSCINPSLFLLRLRLLRSALFPPNSHQVLLCSRSSALPRPASTDAALGHPGRSSPPLFSACFLCFGGLEISTPIRRFNRGSRLFSLFGNLILVQADASFQLVSELPILLLRGNYMVKIRLHTSHTLQAFFLTPTWHDLRALSIATWESNYCTAIDCCTSNSFLMPDSEKISLILCFWFELRRLWTDFSCRLRDSMAMHQESVMGFDCIAA